MSAYFRNSPTSILLLLVRRSTIEILDTGNQYDLPPSRLDVLNFKGKYSFTPAMPKVYRNPLQEESAHQQLASQYSHSASVEVE